MIHSDFEHLNFMLRITENDYELAYSEIVSNQPQKPDLWRILLESVCQTHNDQLFIQKFLDDIHAQPYAKDAFGKWGLELATGPATITGRNIHKERILCGKGVEKAVNANADFGNIVTKSPMLDPVNLKDWVLFYEKKDEKKVREFVSCYQKCARQLAQTVEMPDLVKLESGKCDVMARGINDYLNSKNGKCQLVVNIMASKREDKYTGCFLFLCVRCQLCLS